MERHKQAVIDAALAWQKRHAKFHSTTKNMEAFVALGQAELDLRAAVAAYRDEAERIDRLRALEAEENLRGKLLGDPGAKPASPYGGE